MDAGIELYTLWDCVLIHSCECSNDIVGKEVANCRDYFSPQDDEEECDGFEVA